MATANAKRTGAVGIAIALDPGGDIRLITRPNGGIDFALTTGRDEVEQAIRLRLQTRLGEDPIAPEVGLPISSLVGVFNPDFVAAAILRALSYEKRIQSIGQVNVTLPDEDRARRIAQVEFAVKLKSGETLSIEKVFGV